ncbi:uncharacterized protein LOC144168823 isoform X3 [Haemaphysalis longicornis]
MCPDPECCGGLQYHSTGRDLRSQVQKTLQDEDAYHRDEFEGIMTVLQKLGVTSIKNFKFLQTEDLTAKGMPLVASRILISKFGDKAAGKNLWSSLTMPWYVVCWISDSASWKCLHVTIVQSGR